MKLLVPDSRPVDPMDREIFFTGYFTGLIYRARQDLSQSDWLRLVAFYQSKHGVETDGIYEEAKLLARGMSVVKLEDISRN